MATAKKNGREAEGGVARKVAKKIVAKKAPARKVDGSAGPDGRASMKTSAPAADERDAIDRAFREVVNMSAAAIGNWLETKESHVVGAKDGVTGTSAAGPESVGHRSGRRIIELLGKDREAFTASDYAHMRKVVGYVHRHLAQRPAGRDVATSRWRYSLMNWGHDPQR